MKEREERKGTCDSIHVVRYDTDHFIIKMVYVPW